MPVSYDEGIKGRIKCVSYCRTAQVNYTVRLWLPSVQTDEKTKTQSNQTIATTTKNKAPDKSSFFLRSMVGKWTSLARKEVVPPSSIPIHSPSRYTPEHGEVWKADQGDKIRARVEHDSFMLYQRTSVLPHPHKEHMLREVSSGLQLLGSALGSAIWLLYHLRSCILLSLNTKLQQY